MSTLIIGANGQLGTDILEKLTAANYEVKPANHDNIDVADMASLKKYFDENEPKTVINTSAMHNVDNCELDPEKAFRVNGIGARNLALLSKEYGFKLIHISTDYVFDGEKGEPYVESDLAIPLNVYGNTKLAGEMFIRTIANDYHILRVSGLYGENPCRAKGGMNFVKLMLKLAKERDEVKVVDDEFLTPTFTGDIAEQIIPIIEKSVPGMYHVTCNGSCSWYEFASAIFEMSDSDVKLKKADPGDFPIKVPRPKYSVLENANLKKQSIDVMPEWRDSLKKYLKLIR